ncbi:MAG: TonB-dependent receptor [Aliidongia sp.]
MLRGPQGTLWGRNSTGGAVDFVTAKPTLDDFHGSVEIGGGSYDAFETRGFVNLPVNDQLAFRVAFADSTHEGYVNYQEPPNIPGINRDLYVTGGDKYNGQDQKSARISMLFEPTSDFTWNLSYEYFLDRSPPDLFLNQVVAPGQQLYSALVAIPPQQDRSTNTIRSRMDWDINDYLSLTYVSGYQWLNGSEDYNQAGGGVAPTSINTPSAAIQEDRTNYSNYFNTSQEFDLKSTGTHTIDWITGLYYFYEDNDIRFDINQFNGTLEGGPGGFNGSFIQPDENENSEAVFGQATWHIDDRFRFTGGARYTRDEKNNNGGLDIGCFGNQANGQPCVALTPGDNPLNVGYTAFSNFNPQTGKNSFSNTGSAQWYHFTWLARGEYDISPTNLAYVSISTGYKSGGLFDGGGRFGPEALINYELGDKAQLFDGKVVWNNAFYYEDFTGFQFSQPLNVFNAAGQETGDVAVHHQCQGRHDRLWLGVGIGRQGDVRRHGACRLLADAYLTRPADHREYLHPAGGGAEQPPGQPAAACADLLGHDRLGSSLRLGKCRRRHHAHQHAYRDEELPQRLQLRSLRHARQLHEDGCEHSLRCAAAASLLARVLCPEPRRRRHQDAVHDLHQQLAGR